MTPNPTPAPEPAKLLSAEQLKLYRQFYGQTPGGMTTALLDHIAALEQLAARPSPEVAELVAAWNALKESGHLTWHRNTIQRECGGDTLAEYDGLLAAIQKGGAQ